MTPRKWVGAPGGQYVFLAWAVGAQQDDLDFLRRHPRRKGRLRAANPCEFEGLPDRIPLSHVYVCSSPEGHIHRIALARVDEVILPGSETDATSERGKDSRMDTRGVLADPGVNLEEVVCALDHEWFEAHHGVPARVRPHVLGEFAPYDREAVYFPGDVVVARISFGWHVRCLVNNPGYIALDVVPEAWDDDEGVDDDAA
jgi:hypothetical protein